MAIKIIEEPDIYLTEGEAARLRHEYDQSMRGYAGPPITFDEFVRRQKPERREHVCSEACRYGGIGCQC